MFWVKLKAFFSSPYRRVALITVIAMLIAGTVVWFIKPVSSVVNDPEQPEQFYPIFSVAQSGKFRSLFYNTSRQKTYEIFSVDYNSDYGGVYYQADYSTKLNKFVYSTEKGIFAYDPITEKHSELLKSNLGDQAVAGSGRYLAPKWSPDSNYITYVVGYYEGSNYGIMKADGTEATTVSKSVSTGALVWANKGDSFAVASSVGLGSERGLFLSQAPLHKLEKHPGVTGHDLYSLAWSRDDSQIVYSGYDPESSSRPKLYLVGSTNGNPELLADDEYSNDSLVTLGNNTVAYAKYNSEKGIGAGIYVADLEKKESTLLTSEGSELLFPVASHGDQIIIESPNRLNNSTAIKKLAIYSQEAQKSTHFAEANILSFSGWISSKQVPNTGPAVDPIAPTKDEIAAYEDSLKSRGHLWHKFYDYCWDYACSGEFPYSKRSDPFSPDILSLEKPEFLLTGNIQIPVVYSYYESPHPKTLRDIFEDSSKTNSPAHFQDWLNDQAKKSNQDLNFSLKFYNEAIKVPADCIHLTTWKRINNKCLRDEITNTIKSIDSKIPWLVIGSFQVTNTEGGITDYISPEDGYTSLGSKMVYLDYYHADTTPEQLLFHLENNSTYPFRSLLGYHGATEKGLTTLGSPKKGSEDACRVGTSSDIMCAQIYKSASQTSTEWLSLHKTIIGEITRKELGWFDFDGDLINEVDDPCPFNKTNSCS